MTANLVKLSSSGTVSLSSSLKAALKAGEKPSYGDDRNGLVFSYVWRAPLSVTKEGSIEANRALHDLEMAMAPAQRELVSQWLMLLGVVCATQQRGSEARQSILVYAGMLDHPASAFTHESVKRAARRFQWWPTLAELAAFLDEEVAALADLRRRVADLARARVADQVSEEPPRRYADLSDDEKRAFDKAMAELRVQCGAPPRRSAPPPLDGPTARRIREQVAALAREWHAAHGSGDAERAPPSSPTAGRESLDAAPDDPPDGFPDDRAFGDIV